MTGRSSEDLIANLIAELAPVVCHDKSQLHAGPR